MTTPIVLSLGELLWDMLPSGKRAGGAPVNFAYHAMKNGTEGWAISAVGEDELGDELIAKADEAGINTVIQRNAWPTSTVEVALKNGIPEYTIVKGVAWDHILYTRQLIDVVSKADAVCFGTLALRSPESHATITELLKHTKPGAMKFFDINLRGDHYSKELIEELLKAATVFKINDEELLLLRDMFDIRGTSGEDASRWFLEEFGLDYVILTAGSAYSTIISRKGEVSTLDTPHVEVNDTVGAGDSFSGTFTARILLGDTLAEAHRKAVNTAAYVCTQAGAWPQYPAEMPDYLAISVGDGCTIAGVWKGFKDLYAIGFIDKLPRLNTGKAILFRGVTMSIRDTVTGVQHVGIPTTDLEGTIAYYERLGFECLGIYPNGEDRCTFLRLNNLTLEVWTMNPTPMENGAINHFALDSTDIEASFAEAQKLGLNFVEGSIQHIDTFWSNGIRYFNVLGPNHEVIEFCQIM